MVLLKSVLLSILLAFTGAQEIQINAEAQLIEMWGGGPQFSGVNTFAHLNYTQCLLTSQNLYDVGVIGVPFDTTTTYRAGARFGPEAIRQGSQRQTMRGFSTRSMFNPYASWATLMDCGDIPVTPTDNVLALEQMEVAFTQLLERGSFSDITKPPKLVALGGDHTIILPHLRGLKKVLDQKIAVIHFDSHLDTGNMKGARGYWDSKQNRLSHGSMLFAAHEEGLTTDDKNVHVGIRQKISGMSDYETDDAQGFVRVEADDVWLANIDDTVDLILERIGTEHPVYISVDIDVLDPAFAPGTGTIEAGGLMPRELIHILRKLEVLNIVGGDVVEVAPPYDHADITATNAAQVAYEIITNIVKKPVMEQEREEVKVAKGAKNVLFFGEEKV